MSAEEEVGERDWLLCNCECTFLSVCEEGGGNYGVECRPSLELTCEHDC